MICRERIILLATHVVRDIEYSAEKGENMLRSQIKLMLSKPNFWISLFLVSFYAYGSYFLHIYDNYGKDISVIYDWRELVCTSTDHALFKYFQLLFPFIVIFPFSFSYYEDRERKSIGFWMRRGTRRQYFISKAIACFLGSFLCVWVPFMVNLFLVKTTFPSSGITGNGTMYSHWITQNIYNETQRTGYIPFVELYVLYPVIYHCVLIVLISGLAGLFGVLAYVLSYYIKNNKLKIFLPVYISMWLCNLFSGYASVDTDLLTYVTLENSANRSYMFYCGFCVCIMVTIIVFIYKKTQKDVV